MKKYKNYGHEIAPYLRKYGMDIKLLNMKLFWEQDFAAPVADLITDMGYGYSFNIAPIDDMFHDGDR